MMQVTQAQFDEMARVGTVSHCEIVDDAEYEAALEAKIAADLKRAEDNQAAADALEAKLAADEAMAQTVDVSDHAQVDMGPDVLEAK